jgi:hypothetical protein
LDSGTHLGSGLVPGAWTPPEIDTSRPHPARIYDFLLGGKDNYAVDREAAEAALQVVPEVRAGARANRAFLGRAVRLAAERGIDQYLDLGTGIPGPGNTGDVARATLPRARVAYVDNDPIVTAHTRALLAGADPELTAVVGADVRDPARILADERIRALLDFDRPVAVAMVALLHFITDAEDPAGLVARFTEAVAPGSMLLVSHATAGADPARARNVAKGWSNATAQLLLRSVDEVAGMLTGWELLDPGLVPVPYWRPDGEPPEGSDRILIYGAVGVKV